jgi:hypothetical protein
MSLFTTTDCLGVSNYLYSDVAANGNFTEHFTMPVFGAQLDGQTVPLKGLGQDLYLTIDATGVQNSSGTTFNLLNMTLWADPGGNDGTPSATLASGTSGFSNGQANDIVLATGVLDKATLIPPDNTGTRGADFVDTMTPTLAGSKLLDGSIQQGSHLEVQLTTPASTFSSTPQPDGSTINLVNGGSGQVTIDSDIIKVPHFNLGLGKLRFI